MGDICTKKVNDNTDDINIEHSYRSKYDVVYCEFEKKHNVFSHIDIGEYLYLLNILKTEKGQNNILLETKSTNKTKTISTISSNEGYVFTAVTTKLKDEKLSLEIFMKFIKKKIINNHKVNKERVSKTSTDIFIDYMMNMYEQIIEISTHYEKKKNENKAVIKQKVITSIPKLYLTTLGYLYCTSSMKEKISFLFDLLCNTDGEIEKTSLIFTFFFYLFAVVSYSALCTLTKVSYSYSTLTKIKENDFLFLTKQYDLKNVSIIAKKFTDKLFEDKQTLDRKVFQDRILSKQLSWVLYNSGIRYQVEMFSDKS